VIVDYPPSQSRRWVLQVPLSTVRFTMPGGGDVTDQLVAALREKCPELLDSMVRLAAGGSSHALAERLVPWAKRLVRSLRGWCFG
jgi:hypothetical protein